MVFKRALPLSGREFECEKLMDDVHIQTGCVTVRLCFYKVGRLQYISHLDLQRAMKRAIQRADLPVWYSEGFNPTPRMNFATPLSIGVESLCEFVDVKFVRPVTAKELLDRWNAQLSDELQLYYAAPPVGKLTDCAWASYEIRVTHPSVGEDTPHTVEALFTHPVTVVKHTKSGEKETDISPFIRDVKCTRTEDGFLLECKMCCDNQNFLNPEYAVKAISRDLSLPFDDPMTSGYTVLRTNVFLADGVTPFR